MGEPLSEWNEPNANLRAIRTDDVSTNDDPTFTWEKSYVYDAAGNITTIGSDAFVYDDVDRLTQASIDGASQSYSYDAFGNLTAMVTGGSSKSIPTDPSSNRMIGQTYDAAGNLTSRNGQGTYVYDSLNMLVEYGESGNISTRRILYDADDERVVALGGLTGPHRWTIRGLDGQILREFTSGEMGPYPEMIWEQDHIRGEGQLIAGETVEFHYLPDPTPTSDFMWGGKRHYHLDHLGSVRVVTNDDGKAISENDLFPFGTARTKQYQEQINWGNPHTDGMRFAGHWRDFMGHPEVESDDYIDYMHARYYDPHLGRFLSVDPKRQSSRLTVPQSWNRYTYSQNNSLKYVDPDGRDIKLATGPHSDAVRAIFISGLQRASARRVLTTLARDTGFTVTYGWKAFNTTAFVAQEMLKRQQTGVRTSVLDAQTASVGIAPNRTGANVDFDTLAIKMLHVDPSGVSTLGH